MYTSQDPEVLWQVKPNKEHSYLSCNEDEWRLLADTRENKYSKQCALTALQLSQFHVAFKHETTETTPRSRIAELVEKDYAHGPIKFPFHSLLTSSHQLCYVTVSSHVPSRIWNKRGRSWVKNVWKEEMKQRREKVFVILCLPWSCSVCLKSGCSHWCRGFPLILSF